MGEPNGIDWTALICWLFAGVLIALILFAGVS